MTRHKRAGDLAVPGAPLLTLESGRGLLFETFVAEAQVAAIAPGKPVEVEVENMTQLAEALDAHADSVMLDNFDLQQMREAVTFTARRTVLEASGGVNESTLRAIAETGVDYISIGTLTKDCKAIDLSMRML